MDTETIQQALIKERRGLNYAEQEYNISRNLGLPKTRRLLKVRDLLDSVLREDFNFYVHNGPVYNYKLHARCLSVRVDQQGKVLTKTVVISDGTGELVLEIKAYVNIPDRHFNNITKEFEGKYCDVYGRIAKKDQSKYFRLMQMYINERKDHLEQHAKAVELEEYKYSTGDFSLEVLNSEKAVFQEFKKYQKREV